MYRDLARAVLAACSSCLLLASPAWSSPGEDHGEWCDEHGLPVPKVASEIQSGRSQYRHSIDATVDMKLADLEQVLRSAPVYFARGHVHAKQGRWKEAADQFLEAARLQPENHSKSARCGRG